MSHASRATNRVRPHSISRLGAGLGFAALAALTVVATARAYEGSAPRTAVLSVDLDTTAANANGSDGEDPQPPPKPKSRKPASSSAKRAVDAASSADTIAAASLAATVPAPAPAATTMAAPSTNAPAAENRGAIQPITPIVLPPPEPSSLSTPAWPRPEAERTGARSASSASTKNSSLGLGLGNPIDLGGALTRSALSVVVCALIGGVALYWTKKRGGAALGGAASDRDRLVVVASRALAPRRTLHLVEVEGVRILIGVDSEQIRPLAIVPNPPRPAEATAVAQAMRAAAEAARPAAPAKPAISPRPAVHEPALETVDVRASLERAARTSPQRAPDPSALLGLASTLKRHLKNGNGSAP